MRKRLALLLLPAIAGLGLWVSFAVRALYFLMLPLMILLPFSLGFAVQGAALFFSRQRPKRLRFLPLALLLIPAAGVVREVSCQGYFFWQFAAVIWAAAAVLYLLGWRAAWALEG